MHNDDNGNGSGGASLTGSGAGHSADDPRSEPTGRKIRRIESGPPGLGDRPRTAPRAETSLARRRPTGTPAMGPEDATVTAATPAERPGATSARNGRHIGRHDLNAATSPGNGSGDVFGAVGGGLPPLRQPTGELPVVNANGESSAGTAAPGAGAIGAAAAAATGAAAAASSSADELSDWPTDLPVKGVFGATGESDLPATAGVDDSTTAIDLGAADRSIDAAMPSALSAAGPAQAAGRAGRDAAASLGDAANGLSDRAGSAASGLADGASSVGNGLA
ncbi:MAG: hypothetical protein AAFO29_18385, partial [Actinomycetota bacterium]